MTIPQKYRLGALNLFLLPSIVAGAASIYIAVSSFYPLQMGNRIAHLFAALGLAIGAVISLQAARALTRDLRALSDACEAVARGEYTLRIAPEGLSEIKQLASTFNQMNESLDDAFSRWIAAAGENHDVFLRLVQTIAEAIDEKDFFTRGHTGRVTRYSVLIAQELGLPAAQVERIRLAALLHDIGKIGIDDRVLKKPGLLTVEEFEIIKAHPVRGASMLRPIEQLADIIPGVELHHESLDGLGYPYGLKGDEIPMMPRIIAVADTYDAMTSDRAYRRSLPHEVAVTEIERCATTQFDPEITHAFTDGLDEYRESELAKGNRVPE